MNKQIFFFRLFLGIYNFLQKKNTTNSGGSSKTSGQASPSEAPEILSQDGNDEEEVAEVLTPQPITPTTPSSDTAEVPPPPKKKCHAEMNLDKTISSLTAEKVKLEEVLHMNIISNPEETRKLLQKKKEDIKKAVKKKDNLIRNRINQKAVRKRKKEREKEISIVQTGTYHEPTAGRPKKIDDDALISAITDIAIAGSAADERRRTEIINTCKTLDDLVNKLKGLGYDIKRSSVYLRLIPRRIDSIEGQRHKKVCFKFNVFHQGTKFKKIRSY